MRPVVLQMGVTLDGYVAGQGDWGLPPEHPDVQAWKVASLERAGTHIMGRVTYEEMASYWPDATGQYAGFMNTVPKVVFSATLDAADWPDSRIARGDLAEEIAALKNEPGGEIMAHGGAAFVQARPDRRVPPGDPPGRPGRRAAAVQGPAQAAAREPHRGPDLRRRHRHPRLPAGRRHGVTPHGVSCRI